MEILIGATVQGAISAKVVTYDEKLAERPGVNHTFSVDITGAPTAVSVTVLGGVDGSPDAHLAFTHDFSAGELTAEGAIFHLVDKVFDYVQVQISTLTGGTAPVVNTYYTGT